MIPTRVAFTHTALGEHLHTSDHLLADSQGDSRLLGTGPGPTDPIDPGILLIPRKEPMVVEFHRPSKQKAKKKARKFPPPETASGQESEVRTVPLTYGTTDYRELAGNRRLDEDQRIAMVYIAMSLARDGGRGSALVQKKIASAKLGDAVIGRTVTSNDVRLKLLPDLDAVLLRRKAACLMRICSSTLLSPGVKDHAYCHASNKAAPMLAAVERLESYVTKLLREHPSQQEFEQDNDTWWPDFNE